MRRFNVCGAAALVAVAMVWAGGVQAQVVDAVSGKPVDEAVRTMIEEARFARTGSTLAASKAICVGCVPRPLPTEPQGQTWSAVVNDSFLGMRSQFRMTAWRYACSGGDGQQLLLTLEPTHGATNLTGNFHVRQGFRGYNVIPVIDDSRTPLGSSLSRETTVMLSYVGSSSEAFDDDGELELRYVPLGSDDVVLQIPAAAVTPGEEVEEPAFLIDGRVRGSYTVEGATGHGCCST